MNDKRVSVVGRVIGAAHQLEAGLEAALAKVGLSIAKAAALGILAEAGDPLTLGELAERNHCVRSNITQLVDRLEKDGLVRRVNDPADRRMRRAALTPSGRKAGAKAARIWAAYERAVAAPLGQGEAVALDQALGRIST